MREARVNYLQQDTLLSDSQLSLFMAEDLVIKEGFYNCIRYCLLQH